MRGGVPEILPQPIGEGSFLKKQPRSFNGKARLTPGLSNLVKRKGGKWMTLILWMRVVLAFIAFTATAKLTIRKDR